MQAQLSCAVPVAPLSVALSLLLFLVTAVQTDAGSGAVLDVTQSSLNGTIASSGHLVLAFVANWCGRCRQLDPNIKWAAEKLQEDGIRNVKVCRLDLSEVEDAEAQRLKARFEVSELPTVVWVTQDSHSHFEGTLTANGIHEWARGELAREDIGSGVAACDACRVALEAMHLDWAGLVRRLMEGGSVVLGATPRLEASAPRHQHSILQICDSKAVKTKSAAMQEGCQRVLRWHGSQVVARHFSLFVSWCQRSSHRGRELSARELQDCAEQWEGKVPAGRLGLHEKIMPLCAKHTAGAVVKVCDYEPSAWKEAQRAGKEVRVSACHGCEATVEAILFALRTSRLASLSPAGVAKRGWEVSEVVESVCALALNRHEGDATEGPAKRIHAVCNELVDEHSEAIVAALLRAVGPGGFGGVEVARLQGALCRALKVCPS